MSQPCPHCHGTGTILDHPCTSCSGKGIVNSRKKLQVRIPAGVDTGSRLRLSNEGNAGKKGGPNGDLYVELYVRPHDIFQRDNEDLHCEIPIAFTTAALGGVIEVPTITGKEELKIPAGIQSGTRLRMRGKGAPSLRSGHRRGDQYVKILIEVPINLTTEQKKLLTEFAKQNGPSSNPKQESFLNKAKRFFSK